MKFICKQNIFFILTVLLSYILMMIKVGLPTFIEYEKMNWYVDLISLIIPYLLIQLFCYIKFNIIAWIIYIIILIVILFSLYLMYFSKTSNTNGLKIFDNIEEKHHFNYFQTLSFLLNKAKNKND